MAFAVTCKSCQARFLLNDDLLRRKVAGRVVTVRCRQCHAPIEVEASDSDGAQEPAVATKPQPPAPSPTPPKTSLAYKPTPPPPRPAKSATLIGIGAPRPPGASELVALSPGLLNMPAAAAPGPRGFPEPPPPPASLEEISGDWEVTELKISLTAAAESAPESVDDFAEELPPSAPLSVEEEPPSSAGTPSLSSLTHHDNAPIASRDDFFSDMGRAQRGGMAALDLGAPTIDISNLDAPRTNKETLPLFGLADAELSSASTRSLPAPPADRPAPSQRPDSVRSRRNVVAPTTSSVPPPASATRRSAVALPVLVALAAAAGFIIWQRSNAEPEGAGRPEPATQVQATPALEPSPPTPAAVALVPSPAPTEEELTFQTTRAKPTERGAAEPKARAASSSAPPAESASPAKPDAVAPTVSAPPASAPVEPAEPAGPFDREAAASSLTSAATAASTCRKEGDPSGTASVVITFAPSGRVTTATIGGPPFAGTPTGGCIAAALRKARVPAFEGERVTVSKTIVVQ
jgi:predicted Zn finger-like uncharacterized protein